MPSIKAIGKMLREQALDNGGGGAGQFLTGRIFSLNSAVNDFFLCLLLDLLPGKICFHGSHL